MCAVDVLEWEFYAVNTHQCVDTKFKETCIFELLHVHNFLFYAVYAVMVLEQVQILYDYYY